MIRDFYFIILWWGYLFVLGLISLPLLYLIFKNFLDMAYPFGKTISIAIVSYLVWVCASLHLFAFNRILIFLSILVYFIANFYILLKQKRGFLTSLKRNSKIILFEELLFLVSLLFLSYIRGYRPEIEGLEKFMDFGFVNSILKSQYFPPSDMWMSGKTINYYYFGHLIWAVLTKLTNIKSLISYNLSIATIFALSISSIFSFCGNLFSNYLKTKEVKPNKFFKYFFIAGFISTLLVVLAGNLHPLYYFITNHFSFNNYWFPDATRFIVEKFGAHDNTIHEFPIYSFVVADLHGHLSDLPFVILFLTLVFSFFISDENRSIFLPKFSIAFSFILAIMYMTNSWDFPIYLSILGLTSFFMFLNGKWDFANLFKVCGFGLIILVGAVFLSLPFHLSFKQIAEGINLVTYHSPLWQLLVLWGFPLSLVIVYLLTLFLKKEINQTIFTSVEFLILVFIFISTLLIVIPEIIYVKDIYIASYQRANTVFKLVYQSFVLLGISSGFILTKFIYLKKQWFSKIIIILSLVPFAFLVFYPANSIYAFYGELKKYQGLEKSLDFLEISSPDDYQAVLWLEANIKGQPVILEADGDSYTTFNRISSITGLPTVEGWLVHEWLWRGGFTEPQKRAEDVNTIYTSTDFAETKKLIDQYKIKYIFIGAKEKEKFKILEDKFQKLGKTVFTSGNTKIYQLD